MFYCIIICTAYRESGIFFSVVELKHAKTFNLRRKEVNCYLAFKYTLYRDVFTTWAYIFPSISIVNMMIKYWEIVSVDAMCKYNATIQLLLIGTIVDWYLHLWSFLEWERNEIHSYQPSEFYADMWMWILCAVAFWAESS